MTTKTVRLEFSERQGRRIERVASFLQKSGRMSEWLNSVVMGEVAFQEKRMFGHLPPEHHPSAYPRNVVEQEVEAAVPGMMDRAEGGG